MDSLNDSSDSQHHVSSRVCMSSLRGYLYDQSTIAYKYTNRLRMGSPGGTSFDNDRGHYDALAEAVSVLDELEMKQVCIDITTSICVDDD
nr:hypothetical protein CFP56_04957 [Quercus suber]